MIIPLTLPPKSSLNGAEPALPSALARLGSSEFFLLELQGELEVTGDKQGQLVGRLTIDDTNDGKGKPTLRIGHHLLEGKIANLPKPLAILQRRTCVVPSPTTTTTTTTNAHKTPDENSGDIDGDVDMRQSSDNCETKDDNTSTPPAATATATSYAIHTLVRKKIIFSKRPTPIVGLSAKTT
ncbi:Ctf8-domain-containing protein [Russula emetica]|nr:Ctf8-domain-containing protein [Russula emetica]